MVLMSPASALCQKGILEYLLCHSNGTKSLDLVTLSFSEVISQICHKGAYTMIKLDIGLSCGA